MRQVLPLLTAFLSRLTKRQTDWSQNNGQYTIWTSTPTTYVSWYSTEIITVTEWVPCPVTTSYTTTTRCSNCPCNDCGGGGGVTICPSPKYCKENEGGQYVLAQTTYEESEIVSADVSNGGLISPTNIPYSLCTSFTDPPINSDNFDALPTCSDDGPVPGATITCIASPCILTTDYANLGPGSTVGTPYEEGDAPFTDPNNNAVEYTTYTACNEFTSPAAGEDWYVTAGDQINYCGADNLIYGDSEAITTGPNGDGPFHYSAGGIGNRLLGGQAHIVFFWIWAILAAVAGVGMLVL